MAVTVEEEVLVEVVTEVIVVETVVLVMDKEVTVTTVVCWIWVGTMSVEVTVLVVDGTVSVVVEGTVTELVAVEVDWETMVLVLGGGRKHSQALLATSSAMFLSSSGQFG